MALRRNPTAGYTPSYMGMLGYATNALDGVPWFTWLDVPRMMRDPRVRFLLRMWRSPFQQVQWKVKAESPRVARYVDQSLRRIWRRHVPKLLDRYCKYGFAPAGVCFGAVRDTVRIVDVDIIEPIDAKPLIWKREHAQGGKFAGFRFPSGGGVNTCGRPHAVWYAGMEEYGTLYDTPVIAGMFEPWAEKRTRGGAVQMRRAWFRKCAGRGVRLRHPPGRSEATDEFPQGRDNQDIAREILDYAESTSHITAENTQHPSMPDKFSWEWEEAENHPDVAGFREYPQDLDKEMSEGAGIPNEVFEAADVGSGWSGRMVPLLAFFGGVDERVGPLIESFEPALRYGVQCNFGRGQWFEIEPESLTETIKKQAESGPGGSEGPNPVPGLMGVQQRQDDRLTKPVAMSTTEPVEPPKKNRSKDLVGLIASAMFRVQERATLAGKPESAKEACSLLAALLDDPDQVSEILGGVELAWHPYTGPKGGKGYINDKGRVVYTTAGKPGERTERQKEASAKTRQILIDIGAHRATPEQMKELADHLPHLTIERLRAARVMLNARFGGGRRRAEMVQRLTEHIQRSSKPAVDLKHKNADHKVAKAIATDKKALSIIADLQAIAGKSGDAQASRESLSKAIKGDSKIQPKPVDVKRIILTDGEKRELRLRNWKPNAALDKAQKSTAEWLSSVTIGGLAIAPHVTDTATNRAFAYKQKNIVAMCPNQSAEHHAEIFAHELAHHIEFHKPGVNEATKAFLAYRVGDEKPSSLQRKFPGNGFSKREVACKDQFDRHFPLMNAYYCGKQYREGFTEILSMGVQELYRNAAAFAKNDPEYAAFVVSVLSSSSEELLARYGKGTT